MPGGCALPSLVPRLPDGSGSAGRNGGRTTYERYGPEQMAQIGKNGFQAVGNRYSGGDAAAAKDRLHLQAVEGQIDRLVPDKLNSGEETP